MRSKHAPHAQKKAHVISFRVTSAEYARLVYNAAASASSVNVWVRGRVLSGDPKTAIEIVSQCDPALLKQLHHIGHNLNQLVKNAHIFGRVSPHVEQLCIKINRLLDQAVKKEPR